jgi:hypothetical protein
MVYMYNKYPKDEIKYSLYIGFLFVHDSVSTDLGVIKVDLKIFIFIYPLLQYLHYPIHP